MPASVTVRPVRRAARGAWLALSAVALSLLPVAGVHAQVTNTFVNYSSGTWLNGSNWSTLAVPGSLDVASFGLSNGGVNVGINMATVGTQQVGAVEVTSARTNANLFIGNSSTTVNGTFQFNGADVNGVPNTVLRHDGAGSTVLTIQNSVSGGNKTNNLVFNTGASAAIIETTGSNTIVLAAAITNVSAGITKTGTGRLTLTGANSYTGTTTISAGTVQIGNGISVAATGNLGSGDVVNDAGLFFFRAGTNTVGNNISGAGSVSNSTTHSLILSGSNSYAGKTVALQGGVVVAVSTNALPGFDAANRIILTNNNGYASAVTVRIGSGEPTDWALSDFDVLRTNVLFASAYPNAIGLDYTNLASPYVFAGFTNGEPYGFAKSGAGQLIISNVTSYLGSTVVLGGTLTIQGGRTNGAGPVDLRFGTLEFDLGSGNTFLGTNGYRQGSMPTGGNAGQSPSTVLNVKSGTVTIVAPGGILMGDLNAAGGVGTINVTGGALNFTGGAGVFTIGAKQPNIVNVTNGIVTFSNTGDLRLGNNGASGAATSAATLNIFNGGVLIVSNAANMLFGGNTSSKATVNLLTGGVFQTARDLLQTNSGAVGTVYFNGGTLRAGATSTNFIRNLSLVAFSTNGGIIDTTTFGTTILQPLVHFASMGSTNDGGLVKRGSGTLTLGATNTFTGPLQVQAGTLRLTNTPAAIGAAGGVIRLASNTVLQPFVVGDIYRQIELSGKDAQLNPFAGNTAVLTNGIVLDSGYAPGATDAFKFESVGTTVVSTVAFNLPGLQVNKGQAGELQLNVTGNTYRLFWLYAGLLRLGASGALDPAGVLDIRDNVTAFNLADLNGFSQTVGSLINGTLNSNQITSATPATLAVNPTNTATFLGTISGAISLVKQNTGTQVLSGGSSYTGATIISNGTLRVNGSLSGSSLVTVGTNAILSGTGTVTTVQVDAGGILSPGVGVGTLNVTGNAGFGNGGIYAWDYNGVTSDLVTAATASFNTAWTLAVTTTNLLTNGVYTLLSTTGGVTGFVAPTVTGATGVVSVSGNDVVLTIASGSLTPFETWQTNYFGPGGTTNANAAYDADPDGDGANNLLEYAFGSIPTTGSSVNLPVTGTSGNFLTITVPRNSNATDISYLVQGATDLLSWVTLDTLSATNPAPGGTTVTYTNATGFDAFPAQFLRVKVTQP